MGEKDERGKALFANLERVWVPFCKIAIVSFLSVGYKSDVLYCRMAGTPSSPTLFSKRKKRVESREVEINIKYTINITVDKRVEITRTSGKNRARGKNWPGMR